ncbi:MAG TPA: hypothetical protein VKA31_11445 [Mariprofundaceae bacterium]|nr:hypothetical protein [Mariprofundaceae bacterium]
MNKVIKTRLALVVATLATMGMFLAMNEPKVASAVVVGLVIFVAVFLAAKAFADAYMEDGDGEGQ